MNEALAVRWEAPELSAPPPRKAPSVEEIDAIERAAREEGFAHGKAEGFAQGQAEVRRLIAQLGGVLDSFGRPLAQLDAEVETMVAALACEVAGALIGRAYEAEPALLAELVSEALRQVGPGNREAEVRLHPEDLAAIRPLLEITPSARLVADAGLGRGDVRVHTESLRLDGSLAARLKATLLALSLQVPQS